MDLDAKLDLCEDTLTKHEIDKARAIDRLIREPSGPKPWERKARVTLEDLRWQDDAACLGVDPDLFFPNRGESTRQAKAICAQCPVREECLEYALTECIKFGVFGGLSERERRRIRGERRRRAVA